MRLFPPVLLSLVLAACADKGVGDTGAIGDDGGVSSGDADGDGFDSVADGGEDCDDTDATVHPDAGETPYDGIDNDCDETTPDDDLDGDGFSAAEDCDDTDAAVNPDATEACNDIDDDCNGEVDDNTGELWYADADGDGYGDPETGTTACDGDDGTVADATDCDDLDDAVNPAAEEVCNELDDDCDGEVDEDVTTTWYVDIDGDGYGDASASVEACSQPTGYADNADDCDDADADANPETAWYADVDGDGYGDADSVTEACEQPAGTVDNDEDCDDADASLSPDTTWYIDYDGDGYGVDGIYTTNACEQPSGYVANTDDCDDSDADVLPGGSEVCNGIDDDCDGLVDDDDSSLDTSTATTWYADGDGDGFGDADDSVLSCDAPSGYVDNDEDCDDDDADTHPDGTEEWFDETDSDCDGDENPDHCRDDPPESTVAVDSTCTYTPTVGSFNPTVEWEMDSFDDYANWDETIMSPMVGQLTDDDGDGEITDDDTPDIVIVNRYYGSSTYAGVLRIISGDGTDVPLSVYDATWDGNTYYPYRYANVALGDVDLDGEPEIVTTVVRSSTCYAGVYETDGTLLWVNTDESLGCRSHSPALADMGADGDVEVVVGNRIYAGEDGTLLGEGSGGRGYHSTYSNSGYHSVPVDLDGDGTMEVVAGSSVYDEAGSTLCSTGYTDGYVAVADLDDDGEGEWVVSGNGYVRLFDGDCALIDSWSVYGGGYGGPPTIADYDGDGDPEIGLPGDDYYSVYEADGTRLWAEAIDDGSSSSTGSSVFDFDGDGQAEVVYADETRLWVYDGATGDVLLEDSTHASGTVNEYPVIADVDGDGKAEIVVPNDYTTQGVMVIGDADDNWVSARRVWNQHAYSITNIDDDLAIPSPAESNWPDHNNFRQGGTGSFSATDAPNVYPEAYSACQSACGDDVEFIVQVGNDGLIRAASSLTLVLYGEDSAGTRTELDSETFGEVVDSGELTDPYSFVFSAAELADYDTVVVVVDDDGASNECDETDNEATVDLSTVCE